MECGVLIFWQTHKAPLKKKKMGVLTLKTQDVKENDNKKIAIKFHIVFKIVLLIFDQ